MTRPAKSPTLKGARLAVEYQPIEKLIPYARNARTHSDKQVAQIAASMPTSEWAFCTDNDCYAATTVGDIYRVCRRQLSKAGRVVEKYETVKLSGSVDKDGYRVYRMAVGGQKKHVKGHRLVAGAFLGQRDDRCVNHRNGDKQDNSLANLEWTTVAQNNAHAIATGLLDPRKPNIKNTKVHKWDYATIHALHKINGLSRADLARHNACSRQAIDNVIAHVDALFREMGIAQV